MDKPAPLVTVVVPTYNHENYVLDCITSILEEDYPAIELIVINDGSTDSTDLRIRGFIKKSGRGFKYISKPNEGVCRTMNLGLGMAKGKYFCEVCSDDILLPGGIRKRVDYLEANPAVDAVFGHVEMMDASGRSFDREGEGRKKAYTSADHTFEDFVKGDAFIIVHAGMYKTSVLRDLKVFDGDFYTEDTYAQCLLAMHPNIASIGETVLRYRRHDTNISKTMRLSIRRDKVMAFEKLYASAGEGRLKEVIRRQLFTEYLKYVKVGLQQGVNRGLLTREVGKAIGIRPWSFKAFYYMLVCMMRGRLDKRRA
ncbi:MAG: glycosyltransferase family 2 protein [Deltaproteobacteria bacterium]|nr:glycosyltransferase family 2 protein [Deltaproteobacteria bacterium]